MQFSHLNIRVGRKKRKEGSGDDTMETDDFRKSIFFTVAIAEKWEFMTYDIKKHWVEKTLFFSQFQVRVWEWK